MFIIKPCFFLIVLSFTINISFSNTKSKDSLSMLLITGGNNEEGDLVEFYSTAMGLEETMYKMKADKSISLIGSSKHGIKVQNQNSLDLNKRKEALKEALDEKKARLEKYENMTCEEFLLSGHKESDKENNLGGESLYISSEKTKENSKIERDFSNKKNYFKSINTLLDEAKEGGHIFLYLNDHGEKWEKENEEGEKEKKWVVRFGESLESEEENVLSTNDLKELLPKLKEKGAYLHLGVDACYSGGFVEELTLPGTNVCVTADSNMEKIMHPSSPWSSRPFSGSHDYYFFNKLNKYSNQLQAHVCSSVFDSKNESPSSLDKIVNDWKNTDSNQDNTSDCNEVESINSESFSNLYDQTLEITDKILRESVENLFNKYIRQTLKECTQERDSSEIGNIDKKIRDKIKECADIDECDFYLNGGEETKEYYKAKNICDDLKGRELRKCKFSDRKCKEEVAVAVDNSSECQKAQKLDVIAKNVYKEKAQEIEKKYGSNIGEMCTTIDPKYSSSDLTKIISRVGQYDEKEKNFDEHLEFIKKASLNELKNYQDALCCLSYNFRERSWDSLCGK